MIATRGFKLFVVLVFIGFCASAAPADWSASGPVEPTGSFGQSFVYNGPAIGFVFAEILSSGGTPTSSASELSGHFVDPALLDFNPGDWTLDQAAIIAGGDEHTYGSDTLPYKAFAYGSSTTELHVTAHFDGDFNNPPPIKFMFVVGAGGFSPPSVTEANFDGTDWTFFSRNWDVDVPAVPIPVPSAAMLGFIGLGGVAALKRKLT